MATERRDFARRTFNPPFGPVAYIHKGAGMFDGTAKTAGEIRRPFV
jgi:hypothetical protein